MRPLVRLVWLAPLAMAACKPAAPPPPPTATPIPALATPEPARTEPDALPAPVVYGHVRIPNPTALLEQMRGQLVPSAQRAMLDETALRALLGMGLGERAAVAQHMDLTLPMGCVFTSPKRHERPVTCAIGYEGGLASLVEDLGAQGYVSGDDDHAAYRIEDTSVFLADMGRHVAVSFTPDLSPAVRDRLNRVIIMEPAGAADLAGAVHPAAIFEDSPEAVETFLSATETPSVDPGNPVQAAQAKSQREQMASYGELERADLWLDIDPERVRFGYRGVARPGTPTAKAYASARAFEIDRELVGRLPAESFMVMRMDYDPAMLTEDPMFATMRAMTTLDGSDAARAVAEVYQETMALWGTITSGHAAAGLLHPRGSKGAVVMLYRTLPGVDAQAKLIELMEHQQEASKGGLMPFVTVVRPRGLRVGKLRGGLVALRPNPDALTPLPGLSDLEKALGRPVELQMAFVQRGDVLTLVFALDEAKPILARALAAGQGKRNLAGDAAAMAQLEQRASSSIVVLADMRGTLDWLVAVSPMDPPRVPLGGGFDDVMISMQPGAQPGEREVWIDMAQPLIDQLLTLAD